MSPEPTTFAPPPKLEWSLPVVYDGLSEFYAGLTPAFGPAHLAMTRAHFALWTALIFAEAAQLETAQLELAKANLAAQSAALGVERASCRAANLYVAGELLELILRRFRRMPDEARANNTALLAILADLQAEFSRDRAPDSQSKSRPLAA